MKLYVIINCQYIILYSNNAYSELHERSGLKKHIVKIHDKEIVLGPTEYKLLLELMKSSGRVLSREQLLDNVWGISASVDSRTVDVHIGRLRKSIKKVTDDKVIKTVRSFGYSLIDKS